VSTTHVVASSVVGVGTAHGYRRVRWAVATEMALAWLITLPGAALLGAAALPVWRLLA
jgi:PiT family inorganic phosphate transporter